METSFSCVSLGHRGGFPDSFLAPADALPYRWRTELIGTFLEREFKASSAPTLTRGFHQAIDDLAPEHTYVIAPVDEPYPVGKAITCQAPQHIRGAAR